MRKKKIDLEMTPLEKTVFNILLDSDHYLTHENIIELMPDNKWNKRSVYTALSNLKKKGLIKEAGKILVARTRAILYCTTLTKPEYYEAKHRQHFESLEDGSVNFVLSALTGFHEARSQEVVEEIEMWLEKQKQQSEKNTEE